jgi:hypothetical protein
MKLLTAPRLIAASLALGMSGCGSDGDGRPAGSPSPAAAAKQPSEAAAVDPRVLWPAPQRPLDRTVAAGLEPERKEHLTHHVHAHLDVFVDGKPITVPAGIGIEVDDPEVRRFDDPDGVAFGGIERCRTPCISPLHTHDETGVLHTESAHPEPNTLGQFFTEWGVRLSRSCVGQHCAPATIAIYVDGRAYAKDPRAIKLTDRKEIAIVIGTPPPKIPKTADFSNA